MAERGDAAEVSAVVQTMRDAAEGRMVETVRVRVWDGDGKLVSETVGERAVPPDAEAARRLRELAEAPTRPRRPSGCPMPGSGLPVEDRAAYGRLAGLLDPPRAGPEAFPQGFIAPQARAGNDLRAVAEVRARRCVSGP